MKMKRIIAALLSAVTLFATFACLAPAAAAADLNLEPVKPSPLKDYSIATEVAFEERYYDSAQVFLNEFMELRVSSGMYQLYTNHHTGEVALKNRLTGQILSTNPYAMGELVTDEETDELKVKWWSVEETREKLLSQIIVNFKDSAGNKMTMDSFTEAAKRGQIVMKDIKNGVRVEYTLGRLNTTYLLPHQIMKDRFEEEILDPIMDRLDELLIGYGELPYDPETMPMSREEYYDEVNGQYATDFTGTYKLFQNSYYAFKQLTNYYELQDPDARDVTPTGKESMQKEYPITAEKDANGNFYAIYVLDDEKLGETRKTLLEGYVKTYCPEYGYDDLEADHKATKYVSKDAAQNVFRLALEYVLDKDGMTIRLPASGIRYDESRITLENIIVNPYFGAGNMMNEGYVFFPDGSGSIFEFEDLYNEYKKVSSAPSGKIYGEDYAYYTITGQHQESIRMPVYGIVETEVQTLEDQTKVEDTRGYLAIVTEGDALTELTAEFGATEHPYASVFSVVTPRPVDEYELDDAISATGSGSAKWTVVSDKKYIGNYKTKIVMLTDRDIGDSLIVNGDIDSYYSSDWIGMATAYRTYLADDLQIIKELEDTKDQLPLYIETFGTIETTEKFLSMPITVDVALTKFSEVKKMYQELSEQGIKNINFRLVGFANGGMNSLYPAKLKWEKEAGGSSGFKSLLADAKEKGYGVYPDFDFLYINNTGLFDGISEKDMAVRTVDDRYASKQIYDAVYQDFFSYYNICVASSQLTSYFKKFNKSYSEYKNATGISLAYVAENLNSNFDEDDSTNREEAKKDYIEFLETVSEKYSVLSEGGNIYTVPYVDHMLNMPIESSNYSYSSYSVPFFGMVLHGYLNYAGTPFNEAGDVDHTIMRSIENGMAAYYVLSYNSKNTALLKQDDLLSQHYSIRYDIWYGSYDENGAFEAGELLNQYHKLNAAIGDLQTAKITNYLHLYCERVRKDSEIRADALALIDNMKEAIVQAASDLTTLNVRQFRRELEIAENLEALETASDLNRDENLNALKDYMANGLAEFLKATYDRKTIYSAEQSAQAVTDFVNAFIANADVDTIPLDNIMSEAIADEDALRATYRAYVKTLPPDQKLEDTVVVQNIERLLDMADAYHLRHAMKYATDYLNGTFKKEIGKTVGIAFDRESVIDSIEAIIGAALNQEQLAAVDETIEATTTKEVTTIQATVTSVDMVYVPTTTESFATDDEDVYQTTVYTIKDSHCSMVTYTEKDGHEANFILNYNLFDIEVRYTAEQDFSVITFADDGKTTSVSYKAGEVATITIPSYAFVRID